MDWRTVVQVAIFLVATGIVALTFHRLRSCSLVYRSLMALGFLGLAAVIFALWVYPDHAALLIMAAAVSFGLAGFTDWLSARK